EQRQPDDEDPEGQQGVGELVGHVDADGGGAGDGDLGDPQLALPVGGVLTQIGHQVLGGLLGGSALGDHGDHREVGARVRGGDLDLADVVVGCDVGLELVDHVERIGGVDDVGGHQQGAVVAGSELRGDQVIGVTGRGAGLLGALIGQGELEVLDGDGQCADADDDDQDGQGRDLGDQAHPAG